MIKLTHLLNEVRVYGKFDKKKLLKLIKKQDDAMIQNSDGKEFVIYSPFTNNKDNVDMWKSNKYVVALNKDSDEHEIDYKDITMYSA